MVTVVASYFSFFLQANNVVFFFFLLYGRSKFCVCWLVCKLALQRRQGHFIVFISLPVYIACMRVYVLVCCSGDSVVLVSTKLRAQQVN